MPLQTSVGDAANAPVVAPVVTVNGQAISSPQATYQAAKAQRRELTRQMDELDGKRSQLSQQLQDPQVTGADRKGLETQVGDLDSRISSLNKAISDADAQVAKAAGIPGAAIDLPEPREADHPMKPGCLAECSSSWYYFRFQLHMRGAYGEKAGR